uniref:Protein MIZU-KUSSEI 1 n=1 Tax=Aegilops tauschii subsp. strangulata TaxID=200361 RepID=A0A453PDB0_AEGTS
TERRRWQRELHLAAQEALQQGAAAQRAERPGGGGRGRRGGGWSGRSVHRAVVFHRRAVLLLLLLVLVVEEEARGRAGASAVGVPGGDHAPAPAPAARVVRHGHHLRAAARARARGAADGPAIGASAAGGDGRLLHRRARQGDVLGPRAPRARVREALKRQSYRLTPQARAGEKRRPLLEEPTWRAYCNGLKCGYAVHRECGADEWRVLGAVEQVSVGAGVLPDDGAAGGAGEGDLMYMRAKFERVVGSRDSEAFYMMNPDGSGGPELSIYLLRV